MWIVQANNPVYLKHTLLPTRGLSAYLDLALIAVVSMEPMQTMQAFHPRAALWTFCSASTALSDTFERAIEIGAVYPLNHFDRIFCL